MKEDFLHYIWKNQFIDSDNLFTVSGRPVSIISQGVENTDSGPDFIDAKIKIDNLVWAGNVEIHKKSSDWYAHGHERDPVYDNVILHVVFDDNMPVYNSNNRQISTLLISKYMDMELLKRFNKLIKNKAILRCQNEIGSVDLFIINNFKYKLFFERLEQKNVIINSLLHRTNNDWQQVLYETLFKYFGGTVNKEAFRQLATYLPFNILKKYRSNLLQTEALLFGVGGLLFNNKNDKINNEYIESLEKEFLFLQSKHNLTALKKGVIRFHRLRPMGFPTIRLAQFAMLYHSIDFLFDKLMQLNNISDAYDFMRVTASKYWNTHYNFDKLSKYRKKTLSEDFIDRILINVVVPLKFAFFQNRDIFEADLIIDFIEQIKPEKNKIIDYFRKIKLHSKNALDTQAIIQLNNNYCKKSGCLKCDIGNAIIKK